MVAQRNCDRAVGLDQHVRRLCTGNAAGARRGPEKRSAEISLPGWVFVVWFCGRAYTFGP